MNWSKVLILLLVLPALAQAQAERWLDPRCTVLDISKNGPFIQDADGALLAVTGKMLHKSTDAGKTWSPASPEIASGLNMEHVGHVGQMLRTREKAIVITYLNFDDYTFKWNDEKNEPDPSCKLELWSVRSIDGGKTWIDNQQLLAGYNADYMGFIQTSKGRLVATVEHLDPDLKRWVVCSFISDDDGKTWRRGNWIDLGGRGHHDGAVEPMAVELKDGRLMMLIRTNLDQFWRAYSDDGLYWRTIEPSGIDASSAPGWLTRLQSGRLVLVWNRLNSERKGEWEKSSGPSTAETPASWHREELSIAFSDDDGKTWSKPTLIAYQDGGQFSYPYILERAPGELWVFTRYTYGPEGKQAPFLALSVDETDLPAK
ncbi:MAG: sialidase family protein [Candidatus Hydrogenedentes bacterium]|nr:sialidase family protein [Candidatus Hydrogenedentota bacterium]